MAWPADYMQNRLAALDGNGPLQQASANNVAWDGGGLALGGVAANGLASAFEGEPYVPTAASEVSSENSQLPTVTFNYATHPELADNIWQAQKAGFPSTLTRCPPQSRAWLDQQGIGNGQGLSRDEYLFASSEEGGPDSWVGNVPIAQQNAQGAILRNFYSQCNINYGDQYVVTVINHP